MPDNEKRLRTDDNVIRWLGGRKGKLVRNVGLCVSLEGLAEEASEVTHAALKLSRVIRGYNPTTTTVDQAYLDLVKELTDFEWYVDELNLGPDPIYYTQKDERFMERINEED